MADLNWLAIVVGAFIPMVMGFIWYNPKLFGQAWMDSLGITEEDTKNTNMAVTFGVAFLMAAVLAYVFSSYMGYHDEADRTFVHGGFHAGMLGLTVALPVLISNSLFQLNNWTNILINSAYWLLTTGIMGGVIGVLS